MDAFYVGPATRLHPPLAYRIRYIVRVMTERKTRDQKENYSQKEKPWLKGKPV